MWNRLWIRCEKRSVQRIVSGLPTVDQFLTRRTASGPGGIDKARRRSSPRLHCTPVSPGLARRPHAQSSILPFPPGRHRRRRSRRPDGRGGPEPGGHTHGSVRRHALGRPEIPPRGRRRHEHHPCRGQGTIPRPLWQAPEGNRRTARRIRRGCVARLDPRPGYRHLRRQFRPGVPLRHEGRAVAPCLAQAPARARRAHPHPLPLAGLERGRYAGHPERRRAPVDTRRRRDPGARWRQLAAPGLRRRLGAPAARPWHRGRAPAAKQLRFRDRRLERAVSRQVLRRSDQTGGHGTGGRNAAPGRIRRDPRRYRGQPGLCPLRRHPRTDRGTGLGRSMAGPVAEQASRADRGSPGSPARFQVDGQSPAQPVGHRWGSGRPPA